MANRLQVKRLEVNEKSILINETKVAKHEASPGASVSPNWFSMVLLPALSFKRHAPF